MLILTYHEGTIVTEIMGKSLYIVVEDGSVFLSCDGIFIHDFTDVSRITDDIDAMVMLRKMFDAFEYGEHTYSFIDKQLKEEDDEN